MRQDIITKQKITMANAGLDAMVAVSPENVAYVTGFVVPSQPLMRWRHALCAVNVNGQSGMVAVDMEETTVRERLPNSDIRIWGEFTDKPMSTLKTLLIDLGVEKGCIGIELGYLPAGDYDELKCLLPQATFVAADELFEQMRQIKTTDEIDLLRRLAQISDSAILSSFEAASA